ncbi:MAG: putative phosphothreonine lyase domain-containing protein [bacterium]
MSTESDHRRPSTVTNTYWLHAFRKKGVYPESTSNSGKWLVFVPVHKVDQLWKKIKHATEEGKLGGSSKVSTARPNPNATDSSTKVICVYTYDWTDQEDVMRIRQQLRDLGVTSKIPYKADEDTYAGRYRNRGNKRISKYYE